jgi:TDG/mug DNA glycosylase family protein
VGLSRRQLEAYRDASVPDLVAPGIRLLFCGINPGLWTAATQTHFAHPGNRFYPALHRAGITDYLIDRGGGFTAADRAYLLERGVGITNLVNRATARASELRPEELREGARRLEELTRRLSPRVVAVVGVSAYRVAFGEPKARLGRQPHRLAGAELWVVPNPSGLNAHHQLADLAVWYRSVAEAAGVV